MNIAAGKILDRLRDHKNGKANLSRLQVKAANRLLRYQYGMPPARIKAELDKSPERQLLDLLTTCDKLKGVAREINGAG